MLALIIAVLAVAEPQSREGARSETPRAERPGETQRDRPVYFANCSAARAAGRENIRRGEPGYRPALDRDGDGVACESR